jgi:transposase-like protein
MARSILSDKRFHSEEAAFKFLESRIWPNGPVCPHCGGFERIGKMKGSATRVGLYKCYQCRKQFRVTVGTVFESSHVPLNVWLQAVALLTSSKKGISSNQLSRTLGVTLKTAWFMSHRIRLAMADGSFGTLLGSGGKVVEVDETAWGKIEGAPKAYLHRGGYPPQAVRPELQQHRAHPCGARRPLSHLPCRGARERGPHADPAAHVAPDARLMSDEWGGYNEARKHVASHETVKHGKEEYVHGDVHTNTVEGYFSVFKRGMRGVYQHCSEKHLHRYLAEFNFRYSNRVKLGVDDAMRADIALKGIVGKRLTYRTTDH